MAAVVSPERLHEAIRGNAADVVLDCLERGADPNSSPVLPLLDDEKFQDHLGHTYISEELWFTQGSEGCKITPLHMAVRNCFHNFGKSRLARDPSDAACARNAQTILQLLIDHGADVENASDGLIVGNIPEDVLSSGRLFQRGWNWREAPAHCKPIDLAIFLKQHDNNSRGHSSSIEYSRSRSSSLDEIVRKLQKASRASGNVKSPMVQVPQCALQTWKSLLFSELFSDVRFVCSDGEVLHAHKNILAAASEYFCTLFSGPWAENHADGQVKTSNPLHIMKAVLSFAYIGSIDQALLDEHASVLVSVAAQYGLVELRRQSEQSCIRSLGLDTVKSLLELAHLHEVQDLKMACFAFVQRNAATVLTNPEIMSLATEKPELWTELVSKITPPSTESQSGGSKKRARHAI